MYTMQDYFKSTIRLINSLIIKIDDEQFFMDYMLDVVYGIKTTSYLDSKYYMNLAGIKHSTNRDIYTYIPDINSYGIITNDNINQYPTLKSILMDYGDDFNNLCKNYPNDTLYIRGILTPIDMEAAYMAENGTILFYSDKYIEESEMNLISEMETYIKNFLSRYHNREYMIDELYLGGMLSSLYSSLVTYVLARRMEKINSFEASSFHIDNKLYAYKKLDGLEEIMSKQSLIWLYGVVDKLKTNIGENYVLDNINENLLDPNNVGLANIEIYKEPPTLIEDNIDYNTKQFYYGSNKLDYAPRNSSYVKDDDNDIDVKGLLDLQAKNGLINTDDYDLSYLVEKYTDKLSYLKSVNNRTKTFIIDNRDLAITYPTTVLALTWYTVLYNAKTGNMNLDLSFIDPVSKQMISINPETLFYYFLKLILVITGKDDNDVVVSSYYYDFIFNNAITADQAVSNLLYKDELYPLAEQLITTLNTTNVTLNDRNFKDHIKNVLNQLSLVWYMISNSNDQILSAELKIMMNRIFKSGTITEPTPVNINTYLESRGINTDINVYYAFYILRTLLKKVLNVDVREIDQLLDILKKWVELCNKFKSYTIQFLMDDRITDIQHLYHNSIMVGNGGKGIITIQKGYMKLYDKSNTWLWHRLFNDNTILPDALSTGVKWLPVCLNRHYGEATDMKVTDTNRWLTYSRCLDMEMVKPDINYSVVDGYIGDIPDESMTIYNRDYQTAAQYTSIEEDGVEVTSLETDYPPYQTESSVDSDVYDEVLASDALNDYSIEEYKDSSSYASASDIDDNTATLSEETNYDNASTTTDSTVVNDTNPDSTADDSVNIAPDSPTVVSDNDDIVESDGNTFYTVED